MRWKTLTIQTKFLVGLGTGALLLGLIFVGILYFHLHALYVSEVSEKSNLILNNVDAVQKYVRTTLRPTMFEELPRQQFIIQAMSSSYISRQVMEGLSAPNNADYYYRRVAFNARNPDYAPNGFEKELIRYFRSNPKSSHWEGFETLNGQRFYLSARPVTFTKRCMQCHGKPQDAPQELLEKYDNSRGFGHTVGETSGVVCAGFPVQHAVAQIKDTTLGYLMLYLAAMLIFSGMISVYFQRLIVHNLQRLTGVFRRHFPGEREEQLLDKLQDHDEIEELILGTEELAAYLKDTRRQIMDYAENLEHRVAERTHELRLEAQDRHADVHLFVNLLDHLNNSQDTNDLLLKTLELFGRRFKAKQVNYYCLALSNQAFGWPDPNSIAPLPEQWKDFALEGHLHFDGHAVYIPVRSQDQLWGVLSLVWETDPRERHSEEVLLALGQQVGISLENIHALYDLMRQKDLLQSVFDGISDPLLLVDGRGSVLIANSGAQTFLDTDGEKKANPAILRRALGLEGDGEPVLERTLAEGRPWAQDITFPDGRSFWVSVYPLPKFEEVMDRVVVYARENTSEKQMLHQVQRAEKLSAVGKLAAGLAHEINNPLGVILCYVELLRATVQDDQALSDVQTIEKHAKQAQKVVQDLLNFARRKPSPKGACHINEVVESIVDVFSVQTAAREITLETDLGEGVPSVNGTCSILEQIISNLLMNAMDAVDPAEGRIAIQTRQEGPDTVRVCITDNGPGISKDDMEKIFDPFYTTKSVGAGTGLGLAVVYGLVEELGGRIDVESNGGASFTIRFPASAGR